MIQDRNIRLYMFLRLVMLFTVLLSTLFKSADLDPTVVARMMLVTFFTFLLTTAFVFLYEKARDIKYFPASQIAYDILFTTALIFYIGPQDSMFTIFYFFNIIFAAFLFRRSSAIAVAVVSGALYIGITLFGPFGAEAPRTITLLTTATAFVAIALLAGQLVDELKKSTLKISRLEQLSEEIVEFLDSGLIGLDAKETIQRVNRTAVQLLGFSDLEAVIGKPVREVIPALGNVEGTRVRELSIQGRICRVLASKVLLPEGHSMILLRDLTEIFMLEDRLQRQEKLASVGRLAAGIAHEIRNPIASISGSAQLLGAGSDPEEHKKLASIIVRESERVDRLVAQLLQFAKPTLLQKDKVNLVEIVKECVDAIKARPDFQEKSVRIEMALPSAAVVPGSRDSLSEVVMNLLINAFQALQSVSGRTDPVIKITVRKKDRECELSVADNGPGIPEEYRTRVFDPFFTTKPEGSGLGLARVFKIVRDHEGQVDVESANDFGTTMRVKLRA